MAMKLAMVLNDARPMLGLRAPLIQAARDAGWDVVIIAPPRPEVDSNLIVPWRLSRRGTNPWSERQSLKSLTNILDEIQPDLVHAFTIKPVVYASLAAKRLRLPVLATVTGLGQAFFATGLTGGVLRKLVQRTLRRALQYDRAQVVFQNQDDQAAFVNANLVPERRTHLVPGSGVAMERFPATPLPKEPVVVLAGRMLTTKGIAEYVEASRLLQARNVAARLVLVGAPDPDNAATLTESTLKQWDAEGIIEWWGPSTDMPKVYQSARVVCLPSHGEGLPNVLLEGAASGRVLVATDVSGCRDVVAHGVTGLLVPKGDAEALADTLQAVLEDDVLAESLAAAARARVQDQFEVSKINAQFLALYADSSPKAKKAASTKAT